jgi:peptidoglycan hydrolase CwlO-like protein
MELNVETLQAKEKTLTDELTKFAQTAQGEINALQSVLQNKIRETQRKVDNLEGQIMGVKELIEQLKPSEPKPSEKPDGEKSK